MTEDEYRTVKAANEQRQVELEVKRTEIEEAKLTAESRFLRKHLAVFLTTAVSLAAVIVSAAQIGVAFFNSKAQLDLTALQATQKLEVERNQSEKEIDLATRQNTRTWKFEAARFVVENKDKILSSKSEDREMIRAIMLATFPPEIANPVLLRLQAVVAVGTTNLEQAIKTIERLQPRITYSIQKIDDRIRIRINGNLIYEGGTKDWTEAELQPGDNIIEIDVYNQMSFTGGIEIFGGHKREGWTYEMSLKWKDGEQKFKGSSGGEPPKNQFGTWFNVQILHLNVNPKTGDIRKQ